MSPTFGYAGSGGAYPYWTGFGGLGGLRRHGGSYSPQFTATGLPTDEEIVEMVYDAMDVDPLVPYDADINVDCDAGVVTLTGTVLNKRAKHAAGDDAWWAPGVVDVKNELMVSGRRRARTAPTETEEHRS
ncbi:MAG: BON domain-containing protein [Chloroflexi bacterium]|nr:BON domain-containing protein [Chloroflexota bacterium]